MGFFTHSFTSSLTNGKGTVVLKQLRSEGSGRIL
jgi:hypothetical protein